MCNNYKNEYCLNNQKKSSNEDVLLNPYTAPLKDDRIFNNDSEMCSKKIPINIPTQSFDTNYRQLGILTRINGPEKIKSINQKGFANKKGLLKIAAVLLPLFIISALGISNKEKIKSNYANLAPFIFSNDKAVEADAIYNLKPFNVESPTNSIEKAVISFYETKEKKFLNKTKNIKQHFIIAGSFSSKKNAQKMITKLTYSNFKNSKIVNKSSSGFYRVSYESYNNSDEALIALRKIKKTNPSAWLLSLK